MEETTAKTTQDVLRVQCTTSSYVKTVAIHQEASIVVSSAIAATLVAIVLIRLDAQDVTMGTLRLLEISQDQETLIWTVNTMEVAAQQAQSILDQLFLL